MKIPDCDELLQALSNGTGAGVRIAVIDSGIESSHAQFAGLELVDDLALTEHEGRVVVTAGEGHDAYGHGTAVASAVHRAAPAAAIGSFRVLDARLGTKVVMISAAVREAIRRGYHIINCSFGCGDPYGRFLASFKEWIDEAYLSGVHIVSACNNDNFERTEWPAYFPTVVTCNMGRIDGDEHYYRPGGLVEFVTRGVDIELPWRNGATKLCTGSSYAAPHLSGLLARMLSRFPGLDPLLAKSLLRGTALPWSPSMAGPNVAV